MSTLVYFDLETGGVDMTHPIIQIAAIAVDDNWREVETFERLVKFEPSECGYFDTPNASTRLGDLCAHFGVAIDKAHDALSDVRATIHLSRQLAALDARTAAA